MNLLTTLSLLTLLLTLTSCNKTTESDVVDNQSHIFARYEIYANKNSKKIVGKAIFYEESKGFFKQYISLRGQSYVEFQNYRMQERVSNWTDMTSYHNNYIKDLAINAEDSFQFKYLNNDDQTYINNVKLPSLAEIDPETISIERNLNSTVISFEWNQDSEYNQATFGKKSQIRIDIELDNSTSISQEVTTNPAKIVLESNNYHNIDSISLCSIMTKRAKGLNGKDEKKSTYCDSQYSVE
jgi:hypothetical protein